MAETTIRFDEVLTSIEQSLRGMRRVKGEDGKEQIFYDTKLSMTCIHELMVLMKSVISENTVMSCYPADYIIQKGFDVAYEANLLLDHEVSQGRIGVADKHLLLNAIDHACMSTLLRGLGGLERDMKYESTKTNISLGGGVGSSPVGIR